MIPWGSGEPCILPSGCDGATFLLAGAVGTTSRTWVSIGAGTFELVALFHQHLDAKTSHHHQNDDDGSNKGE